MELIDKYGVKELELSKKDVGYQFGFPIPNPDNWNSSPGKTNISSPASIAGF